MDEITMSLFIFFGGLIALAVLIFLISKLISWLFPNRKPPVKPVKYVPPPLPQQYCTACGSTASPVVRQQGSDAMFVFLLLVFLLPGIIYAIWRGSTRRLVCPRCGNASMIPLDSPQAREALRQAQKRIMFCGHCGKQIGDADAFCTHCGSPRRAATQDSLPNHPAGTPAEHERIPQVVVSAVKEVKLGMTPTEVETAFGLPETRADLGEKVLYKYQHMTVEFHDGKVTDVS